MPPSAAAPPSWPDEPNAVAFADDGSPLAVAWPTRADVERALPTERRRHLRLVDPRRMTDAELEHELELLLAAEERRRFDWALWARPEQIEPGLGYRIWLILAGRGWGKTRTGAETVRGWAKMPRRHFAVIARTHREVQAVCFEGPAGLLACIPPEDIRRYTRSSGDVKIVLRNGTVIRAFSAEDPDVLRGYAFDAAWFDEYAAWPKKSAQAVMDMMWFCLRESVNPRVMVTTTPKALPHVKALVKRAESDAAVALTAGHTADNAANLSPAALAELEATYGGTRLGQQELGGVLLEDVEGALWTPGMFDWDGFRVPLLDIGEDYFDKKVLAVDPSVTSGETSDGYGLSVCGRKARSSRSERISVVALHSEEFRATPDKAMRRVAEVFHAHGCDWVVVETNNGGDYIPSLLASVDGSIPCRKVTATKGKLLRAEPVSLMYEQHRVQHAGPARNWVKLESVMTTFTGDPEDDSPNDLDAHVYGVLALAGPRNRPGSVASAAGASKRGDAAGPPVAPGGASAAGIRRTPPRR